MSKLKLAMISGSWPPDHCGVGDYTSRLTATLKDCGIDVSELGGNGTSGLSGGLRLLDNLRSEKFDLAHIQYPTMGYGRSLVPTALPLVTGKRPTVVTIHEFATFKKIRRPWFLTFAHFVDARIFTSDRERNAFADIMRPTRGLDIVIPIASNIGSGSSNGRVSNSICNFGIISPGKGIEQFLDLAMLCRDNPKLIFNLIGAEAETFSGYASSIFRRAHEIGVNLHLNLPEAEVANLLASQEYAYLPFSDGASARRGSLLAAQQNGVVVMTTHSEQTPQTMRDTTIAVNSPAEALKTVSHFIANPKALEEYRASVGRTAGPSWKEIAIAHIDLFDRILNTAAAR